jgi:hypothetical protein
LRLTNALFVLIDEVFALRPVRDRNAHTSI